MRTSSDLFKFFHFLFAFYFVLFSLFGNQMITSHLFRMLMNIDKVFARHKRSTKKSNKKKMNIKTKFLQYTLLLFFLDILHPKSARVAAFRWKKNDFRTCAALCQISSLKSHNGCFGLYSLHTLGRWVLCGLVSKWISFFIFSDTLLSVLLHCFIMGLYCIVWYCESHRATIIDWSINAMQL